MSRIYFFEWCNYTTQFYRIFIWIRNNDNENCIRII